MKELTKKQQATLKKAIRLLRPFNKEDVSLSSYYFKESEDGEEIDHDYDCCDNLKCVSKTKDELIQNYPNLETIWYDNGGDHDRIDSCYQCSRPLNETLTWIQQEFDHHKEYSLTKRELKRSRTAFDITVLLESMPSCDHSYSGYAKNQHQLGNPLPLEEEIKRKTDFFNEVIQYAEKVITVLSK